MKNKEIKTVAPKLRFPDFQNSEEWKEETIHAIGKVVTGTTPSKNEKEFWGGNFVWITAQDFKDKYIYDSVLKLTGKGWKKSKVIPQNSILVTCIASIGLNGINKIECATNQQINSVICYPDYEYEFVYYAISYNSDRLKSLAGQTAVPIISKSVFENFVILIPEQKKEQQKIADCLSSIDNLITSTTKMIEALKTHKMGLMQQLFPAEGKKVPAMRFLEFQDAGEWEDDLIGNVCESYSGGTPTTSRKEFYGGDIPFIRSAEINEENTELFLTSDGLNNSSAKLINKGDILVALYGANSGEVAIAKIDGAINQAILCLKYNGNNFFVAQFLSFKKNHIISRYIQGGQGNLSSELIKSIKLFFPSLREQQKIADCLSSLDDLISAVTKKLEALKTHKKGLMQQLFPDMTD